jgi:hypothetical protein
MYLRPDDGRSLPQISPVLPYSGRQLLRVEEGLRFEDVSAQAGKKTTPVFIVVKYT